MLLRDAAGSCRPCRHGLAWLAEPQREERLIPAGWAWLHNEPLGDTRPGTASAVRCNNLERRFAVLSPLGAVGQGSSGQTDCRQHGLAGQTGCRQHLPLAIGLHDAAVHVEHSFPVLHCFVGWRHLGLGGEVQTTAAMNLWARLGLQPGSDLLSALYSERVLRGEAAKPASVLDWQRNAMHRWLALAALMDPDWDAKCLTFLMSGFPCPLNTPAEVVNSFHAIIMSQGSARGCSATPARPQAEVLHAHSHVKGRLGKAFMAGCVHSLRHAGYHPPLTYFKAGCCCHADRIGGGLVHGLIASHSADAQKPKLRVMPCNVSDQIVPGE